MLLAAMLLMQAAAPPPEIIVTGERLERLRFSARVRNGRVTCRIRRSSGDRAFDAIACEAVSDCAARALRSAVTMENCMRERLRARSEALHAQDEQ